MGGSAVAEMAGQVSLRSVIGEEEAGLMRKKHHELVEDWLDEASFAAELFKLHTKYGIEMGDEGYATYRKYLHLHYKQNRRDVGPTYDPLEEGCECLYCQLYANGTLDELNEPGDNSSTGQDSPKKTAAKETSPQQTITKKEAARQSQRPSNPASVIRQTTSESQIPPQTRRVDSIPRPPKPIASTPIGRQLARPCYPTEAVADEKKIAAVKQRLSRRTPGSAGGMKRANVSPRQAAVGAIVPVDQPLRSGQRGPPDTLIRVSHRCQLSIA